MGNILAEMLTNINITYKKAELQREVKDEKKS